ncbi:arginine deiminase-related protein [Streptomyces virginiae]|uniref:dimethylargininase n=1 Tax=Streptomyces virginiae TaxID=1961 RepID=UPI0022594C63|nr:dimethylargininase [Streptomyces virginiae]MCX4714765.1 arginine deiminase-related protein [Streptomyces virginiae]
MAEAPRRTATERHYLMCRPTHFEVTYAINPWMNPEKPMDADLALAQWERIRDLYLSFGHTVSFIDPVPGLPDMVFSANGATVVDGKVLLAKFRHQERAAEADAHRAWFEARGYTDIHLPRYVNEGEGDFAPAGRRILAGAGFRSDPGAHEELAEFLGLPVVGLTLTDPRFYHLDTALFVLDEDLVAYYPAAFSEESREVLRELYPDAILATRQDADAFGLNAVSDGLNVVVTETATHLIEELRERGFEPHPVDMSELLKAGGAVKCITQEIRRP